MAKTITHKNEDETSPAMFGDKEHLQVAQTKTFTQMIFEVLTEKTPTDTETKLLDLILNLSIDHGPNSPSAEATILAAKEGKKIGEAIGTGISQINERHGGAGEPLMEILYRVKSQESSVKEEVETHLKEEKRIPGLGHRLYKDKDPRAELIMDKALELGVGEEFIKIIKELKEELAKQSGKNLPINIDGAIAAVFCGFGLEPKLGIAIFIIARAPGLCGHYLNNIL